MDKYQIDCLIIGGGVAGLASAKFLSKEFKKTYLIEKNKYLGMETSSRNSEVIHAGIYYQKNSLKSELCLKGKKMLYQYLKERNINFNNCGKYIVATNEEEEDTLESIRLNAMDCGLKDLSYEHNLKKMYPFLEVKNSIFSLLRAFSIAMNILSLWKKISVITVVKYWLVMNVLKSKK